MESVGIVTVGSGLGLITALQVAALTALVHAMVRLEKLHGEITALSVRMAHLEAVAHNTEGE